MIFALIPTIVFLMEVRMRVNDKENNFLDKDDTYNIDEASLNAIKNSEDLD